MLGNTPRDAMMAFAGLRNEPRFIKFLEYLRSELESSDEKLRQMESLAAVHKQQGCSLTLLSILEKAQSSHSYLNSKE